MPLSSSKIQDTQPIDAVGEGWAEPAQDPSEVAGRPAARSRLRRRVGSCLFTLFLILFIIGAGAAGTYILVMDWIERQPRLNVLILGLDRRPGEGDVVRTDTIMLLTLDPSAPSMGLLSIPRDLYVEIPGVGTNRINTAHLWGEMESAGGGPALAARTVTHNFGVFVHRCVRVDFEGFREVIDAAGGIDVLVEEPIVDHAYPTEDYGTITIEIPTGQHHMDGETALRYARSRHGSSDFDRADRQQQIVMALARRLLSPEAWPDALRVYRAVMENVDSEMTARDLLLAAVVLYRVGPEGIDHCVIDREMTTPWTTPSGGSVLQPRWDRIRPQVEEMFAP